MEFSKNFIQMAVASEELQKLRSEGIEAGEYYYNHKNGEVVIHILEKPKKLKKGESWMPRIDQLLSLFPEDAEDQGGARTSMEGLTNSYHIKNKYHSFNTYAEQLLSIWMHRQFRALWVDGINKVSVEPDGNYKWRDEKELLREKLGLEDKDQSDTRTVPMLDETGKDIGRRTERIKYNFEKGKMEVVEIVNEFLYVKMEKK